jgi:predicted metal-dependent phosphoesterase TrpH
MNVDLHTHTYPASSCSAITYRDYISWCVAAEIEAVALTNHGDVSDNHKLSAALAAEGVLLVHGVEISTLIGDFLVFSDDLDFLATFAAVQAAPQAGELPAHAGLVWAHPAAGGGRSGSAFYPELESFVAGVIDAVEVYNGAWPQERYVKAAEEIAIHLGLARTGGSDAHDVRDLMSCYTELPDPVRSTADVVAALKTREVRPHHGRKPRRSRRFGIF